MRLGRLPANHADIARAPSLRDHHFAAMPPPAKLDRRDIDFQPRMFGNNIYPDCSAAGLANGMLAVSALDGLTPVIADAMVPAFYAECVGVANTDAAIAATDGAVLLDVLRHQATQGFSVGQQVSLAGLFGTVARNRTSLAQTMAALGFAYIGVNLYDRDMQTSGIWDDDGRDPGPFIDGHCIDIWDYLGLADTDTARVATWGGFRTVTWRWIDARLDESWGLFWRQLTPERMTVEDDDRLAAMVRGMA
ncbi:MAG TPA: hypothetical protein VN702_17665 [Acetobacteraceae bacterium]|nr:hypothetical protein [Acetobacteraceae bacterium]